MRMRLKRREESLEMSETVFSWGANPAFGRNGPPTILAGPYIPIAQPFLAATLTQIG